MHNVKDICERAIAYNVPEAYLERGYFYFDKKDYESAYKDFKKAHDMGVDEAVAPLAKCYKMGLGVKADEAKAAMLIDSTDDNDALLYKAKCLIDEKKNDEAKEILIKISNSDEASYTLGMLYKKEKKFTEACNAFYKCYTTHEKAKLEYVKCLYYGNGISENKKAAMNLAKSLKQPNGEINYLLGLAYDLGGVFGYSFDIAKKYYYASAKQRYKKGVDTVAKIEAEEAERKAAAEEVARLEKERQERLLELKYTLKNKYKDDVIRIPSLQCSNNKLQFNLYASGELTFKFDLSYAFEEARITAEGSLSVQYQSDESLEKFKNSVMDYMKEHVQKFLSTRPDYPFSIVMKADFTFYNYK
jgi:TPR repeat protein